MSVPVILGEYRAQIYSELAYYESKNKKNGKKETGFISVESKREYDFYHDVFDDLTG
jgi:hypothetical protein